MKSKIFGVLFFLLGCFQDSAFHGQEVLSERIVSTNQVLNIENITEGFYFLKLEGSVVRLQVVR